MELCSMPRLPRRDREAHKGNFGKVYILAGSVGFTGAPVLAAAGALKTGAGLVFVGTPAGAYPAVAAKLVCAMPKPLPGEKYLNSDGLREILEELEGKTAVLMGPGLGRSPETAALIRTLIPRIGCPLVLDADGINALSGHIHVLDRRRGRVTVLTPHLGEFERLLGRELAENREIEAKKFAMAHGCILVLKGHETVTAFPDGKLVGNPTGNPGMASGGSGDVLAGMAVSLLAQGFPPEEAVPDAVYLHGLAGDLAAEELGEYALTAGDLITYLPKAMKMAEE